MQKILHCSDFDGTLTTADTLLLFIRFAHGTAFFIVGFLLHLPLLVLMKFHLYSNGKMKQRIFSFFFRGMSEEKFNALCHDFARQHQHLLRRQGIDTLLKALERGEEVLIVSASIDRWVSPFFSSHPCLQVIGTQIEVREGRITGRFSSPNCYGAEKVNRINATIPNRNHYYIIAYGDSRGDKEMLDYADERYYQPFQS